MAKLFQLSLLFADPETEDLVQEAPAAPAALPVAPGNTPVALEDAAGKDMHDAAARRDALDVRRSWIVEAPAGSGKTGLLIQRYLRLLAEGGVERPDEVLAITFTRKADGELRHRVLQQLVAAQQGEPLPANAKPFDLQTRRYAQAALARDRALGWRLLESPQQLNIRTIDSFCAELAGSLPLLAGPGGRYQPTDDPAPLYEAAAERTLLQMGGPDISLTRDLETLLAHRDANVQNFLGLLAEMLRQREQWGELVPLAADDLTDAALDANVRPKLDRTLQRMVSSELRAVAEKTEPALLDRLSLLAHELSSAVLDQSSGLSLFTSRTTAPGTSAQELPLWKALTALLLTQGGGWRSKLSAHSLGCAISPVQRHELTDLIGAFCSRDELQPGLLDALRSVRHLPEPEYPDEQWRIVRPLCRVLRHALLELQIVFAERRSCDFTEIALTARTLLRQEATDAEVLPAIIGNLRHLLVDEMQDTSSGQYELLQKLTENWDGATQTLFLVGDPKQSIYEFRLARVERFRRVMESGRFGQIALGSLRLTSNFRSQENLVTQFNEIFSAIFPTPEVLAAEPDAVDVPFVEATATQPAGVSPALHWHIDPLDPEQPKAAIAMAARHARQIRHTIEDFLESWPSAARAIGASARPARVAVLVRNRGHLAPILREFHALRDGKALPFRAVDIEMLNERPEILDLLALTSALVHPADRIAWLSLLRSPAFGLTLPDLLALTGEGEGAERSATVPELVHRRVGLLSPKAQALLERSWPCVQHALAAADRDPLPVHVERTWRSLGLDAALTPDASANVERFFELLHAVCTGPEPFSLGLLRRRLRQLYAGPGCAGAQVELMTIHKAKGLEWDLVLIPSLHRGSGRSDHEFLKWLEFESEDGPAEFFLTPIQSKGDSQSPLSGWLNRRQRRREEAEARRLFYVACTRARERVHLFASVQPDAKGGFRKPPVDSLLTAAWPAALPFLPALEDARLETAPFGADEAEPEPLALAASAEEASSASSRSPAPAPAHLPLGFEPVRRLRAELGAHLPYPDPATLRRAVPFSRPEGSFAARAFGNAVHRFLELTAQRLAGGEDTGSLQQTLPSWQPRAVAVLRSEGLETGTAQTESARLLRALSASLGDQHGAWLLSPRAAARNEAAPSSSVNGRELRADRTFLAGADPLSTGETTHLWIVDYKTAEPGGRELAVFLQQQKEKYLAQMQAYADAAKASGRDSAAIRLALFFPLIPAFLCWEAQDAAG